MNIVELDRSRDRLIGELRQQGIRDERVLDAMRTVRRENFVPPEWRNSSYRNVALPIALGQTISQPYIVALTAEALRLRPTDHVLEIGAGSGYAAAVLSRLAKTVDTVERHPQLARSAGRRLIEQAYNNVSVHEGDGTLGWAPGAPYDAITVAAGSPRVPPALLEQLAIGGRLVIPLGSEDGTQVLTRIMRTGDQAFQTEDLGGVRFVPLIGEQGWPPPDSLLQ